MEAVVADNLPFVQRILQQPPGGGFNVNAADEDGWTALHLAVFRGHCDCSSDTAGGWRECQCQNNGRA